MKLWSPASHWFFVDAICDGRLAARSAMSSKSKEQADYEQLVRQQLTELGYNSDAIPDAVRSMHLKNVRLLKKMKNIITSAGSVKYIR